LKFCVSLEILKREYRPLISGIIDGWRSLKEYDTDRDPCHFKPANSIFFVFFFCYHPFKISLFYHQKKQRKRRKQLHLHGYFIATLEYSQVHLNGVIIRKTVFKTCLGTTFLLRFLINSLNSSHFSYRHYKSHYIVYVINVM
jgi:hypothetical protein